MIRRYINSILWITNNNNVDILLLLHILQDMPSLVTAFLVVENSTIWTSVMESDPSDAFMVASREDGRTQVISRCESTYDVVLLCVSFHC